MSDAPRHPDEPTIDLAGAPTQSAPLGTVGDYTLLQEIARGGMGVVYKAHQASLDRIVAVKMILAGQLADASAVERFQQEARAAASLEHPNIVPIYEVGQWQGQPFYSMAYIEGQSLATRLASGPLGAREAAELIRSVALAVQFAHERGVIHRDLKPANVLLDREGRPRITDFGLAKLLSHDQGLTHTGQAVGTPGYMPPEQVQAKEIGPPADVYALGAILYALVTGRPPFQAATAWETMQQVLSSEPVPPRTLNPGVPRDLDTIITKCLEKRTPWRYATAQELAEELSRFLAGEPIQARPIGPIERAGRWVGKQRQSVMLAIIAVLATMGLLIGGAAATVMYARSLQGTLKLDTRHTRMQAELRDVKGSLVAPAFTVPTQPPIETPEGSYVLRVEGPQLVSEDFQVDIARGKEAAQQIDLTSGALWAEQPVVRSWGLVFDDTQPAPQLAHLLLLDENQLQLRESRWLLEPPAAQRALELRQGWEFKPKEDPKFKSVPGFRWWPVSVDPNRAYRPGIEDQYDFRPFALPLAPQLDGQGSGELVIVFRHVPAVAAVSISSGKVLWCYAAEGLDQAAATKTWPHAKETVEFFGTVAGKPLVVPDLDGDGAVDLIAAFLVMEPLEKQSDQPRRTLEAISGRTGKRLWRQDFEDAWFELPQAPEPVDRPFAHTWFTSWPTSTSGYGHHVKPSGVHFRDSSGREPFTTGHPLLPCPPVLCRTKDGLHVVCAAGTRLTVFDSRSGTAVHPPREMGFVPIRDPQVADVDSNGTDELILIERVGEPTRASAYAGQQRLWCWSIEAQKPLWTPREQAADYEKHAREFQARPAWPLVADLNDDRQLEFIAPNGTTTEFYTQFGARQPRPTAGLEALDGMTGKPIWQQTLPTSDQQFDQYLVGPDIDGDSWKDVFVATLFDDRVEAPPYVYVDALSGRDGRKLWTTRQPLELEYPELDDEVLGEIQWWTRGPDGWPRLLVPVLEGSAGDPLALFIFSAGSGQLVHRGVGTSTPLVADGDADGLDDLFCYQPTRPFFRDDGGKLHSFRGTAPHPWRRLGGTWQVAPDYNADGWDDVLITEGLPVALSGRDGRPLWRGREELYVNPERCKPLSGDLNNDGVPDLLLHDHRRGGGFAPPVGAYCGRTGRQLWATDFTTEDFETLLYADAHNLDQDRQPEVVFAAAMDLDYSPSAGAQDWRLWLVVLDGRTGALRWQVPLSDRGGKVGIDDRIKLEIAIGDLNGDGQHDLAVPAWTSKPTRDLLLLRGRDGTELHRISLDAAGPGRQQVNFLDQPGFAISRFGEPSRPFVVVQDFVHQDPTGGDDRVCQVTLFDPNSRQPLSGWPWNANRKAWSASHVYRRPATPLVVQRGADRGQAICFWTWRNWESGEVVVLDLQGQELWRRPIKQRGGELIDVWRYDVESDGRDELFLIDGDTVQACDVETGKPLWNWKIDAYRATILGLRAGAADVPPTVVVCLNKQIVGLSAKSGQPLWSCGGLANQFLSTRNLVGTLGMLDHQPPTQPPRFLERLAYDTQCLAAVDPLTLPTSAIGKDRSAGRDPRYARDLPWHKLREPWRLDYPLYLASGLLFAPLLLLLPAYSAYRAVRYRRFGLWFLLLLPIVVGLFLMGLAIPLPEGRPPGLTELEGRFFIAAWTTPALLAATLIGYWLARGQWRKVMLCAAASTAVTLLAAGLELARDRRLEPQLEFYSLTDLWVLGFVSGYCSLIALLALVILYRLACWLRS